MKCCIKKLKIIVLNRSENESCHIEMIHHETYLRTVFPNLAEHAFMQQKINIQHVPKSK